MRVKVDLAGMQGHPQPDPLQILVRSVVDAKRAYQRGRQRFYE